MVYCLYFFSDGGGSETTTLSRALIVRNNGKSLGRKFFLFRPGSSRYLAVSE